MNNDINSDTEAKLEKLQQHFAWGAIIGSIGMSLEHIVSVMDPPSWISGALTLISLGGWLFFLVSMLRSIRLSKTPEGMAYRLHATRDERIKANRDDAFTVGFAAMLGSQALLIVGWVLFHEVDPGFLTIPVMAPTAIAIGVSASLIRYMIRSSR